jgi:hypothetical protein
MTMPATPPNPTPAGDDRNLVPVDAAYVAPSFEDKLLLFWQKNGTKVIVVCGLVFVGIVAKGAWEYLERQKNDDIVSDYAAAGTSEKLKAFVASHPGHTLTAAAQLRLADEAYAADKPADAIGGYDAVVAILKTGPFAARAQLGSAMSKIAAGKSAEGEAALKTLAADTAQLKGVRVEAAYHLASIAAEAGRSDEVAKYSEQITQIDAASPWAQRAQALRASLPTAKPVMPAAGAKTPEAPGVGVEIKLPGK